MMDVQVAADLSNRSSARRRAPTRCSHTMQKSKGSTTALKKKNSRRRTVAHVIPGVRQVRQPMMDAQVVADPSTRSCALWQCNNETEKILCKKKKKFHRGQLNLSVHLVGSVLWHNTH